MNTNEPSTSATDAKVVPRWWPKRFYYGWALVGALGLTETASYGVLTYAFAVFIAPMAVELHWSKTQITGAFSLGMLVAGGAAIPVGQWVDRHGARAVMTLGSIAGALLLVAWSAVNSLAAFYVVWVGLGFVMAAVLYEPAFAVIATWFRFQRARALTALTFMGGFASVLFVPLATLLVARHGWRTALLGLGALYAFVAVPLHAFVLRRRPGDFGMVPDGGTPAAISSGASAQPERSTEAAVALRSTSFRWLAIAFGLSSVATTAVSVHLVSLLLERGHSAAFAGAAMGVLGVMALPGRLIFTPLGSHWPRSVVTASIFALSAVACAVLLTESTGAVWVFVIVFGAGFGAITPARAALLAEMYGPAQYGRIAGVLALATSLARAAAPVGASLIYAMGSEVIGLRHGYDALVVVLLTLCLGAGAAIIAAGRASAALTASSTEPLRGVQVTAG